MLYFDEQVSHRLMESLVDQGIDVTTVNLLGHKGQSDAIQLLHATNLNRVVVTHNVEDFLLLHDAWMAWQVAGGVPRTQLHAGILVIHSTNSPSVEVLAPAILDVLRTAGPLANRVLAWDRRNGWQEYVGGTPRFRPLLSQP